MIDNRWTTDSTGNVDEKSKSANIIFKERPGPSATLFIHSFQRPEYGTILQYIEVNLTCNNGVYVIKRDFILIAFV